ncbi:MAG: hypothetical protein LKJ16_02550, partial [Lactobacillus delbrueckii]|nr:hypothetical protein [Lactobacillus delbrueckii subsp. lactis]MCI1790195.1 hypothetical protein [Lactobacillus delbrueckii]MCI1929205.1 hypothetical protein [Lactobacillus delbrueckii]MCI1949737.1 hypothetical protein [Lactobacillus delbrueckii]
TTERTRHFLVKKPKKILQLRLEDKNVFNAIHLNSIGYVFEFGREQNECNHSSWLGFVGDLMSPLMLISHKLLLKVLYYLIYQPFRGFR